MANINDYVRAYGNKTTSSMEFNEFDGLVLSELSYIKWDDVVPKQGEGGSITLGEAVKQFKNTKRYKSLKDDDMKTLLTLVENSERFSNMEMSNFVSKNVTRAEATSDDPLTQFSAVTFTFKDASSSENQNFIAFRGTDNTLEGWEENFHMAFDMHTEAQKSAAEYVNSIGRNLDGKIRIGGHSKGGNQACYSYLFCEDEIREKVVKMYSYDGPGLLNDEALKSENYQKLLELLDGSAIAPYDAVIGLLLDENNFTFVDTNKKILEDHDAFSWQIDIENLSFVEKEQSFLSKLIDRTLDDLVHSMPNIERYILINAVWKYFYSTDAKDFDDILATFPIKALIGIYCSSAVTIFEKKVLKWIIATCLVIAGVDALIFASEDVEDWMDAKAKEIIDFIDRKLSELGDNEELKSFFADLKGATISLLSFFRSSFNKKSNSQYSYTANSTYIKVNTNSLRNYANRLAQVNRRLLMLDIKLDSLYTKAGLADIFDLLQADLMTSYSWRLDKCINYLNDTAYEFEQAERSINSQI